MILTGFKSSDETVNSKMNSAQCLEHYPERNEKVINIVTKV